MAQWTTDDIIAAQISDLFDRPVTSHPEKSIAILSTPRCGSTYYCEMLAKQGSLGDCREWFNFRYLRAYAARAGTKEVRFEDYVAFLMERTTNGAPVFAVNLQVEQYLAFLEKGIDVLSLDFDVLVYLERANKLAQAVSLLRAKLTDQWSADSKPARALPEEITDSMISRQLCQIQESHEYYEKHLADRCAYHFFYEDFTSGASRYCFHPPADRLGVPLTDSQFESTVHRQSDETSERLINGYLDRLTNNRGQ